MKEKSSRRVLCVRTVRASRPWERALLVVVPLRLGLDKLESRYLAPLLECARLPQSVGFIGGRPRMALYFAGTRRRKGSTVTEETDVVGFDPHTVQPALLTDGDEGFLSQQHLDSVKCAAPRLLAPATLDPSLALGFYCRDQEEFLDLCARARKLATLSSPPIFDVQLERPADPGGCEDPDDDDDDLLTGDDDDDDDYVVV